MSAEVERKAAYTPGHEWNEGSSPEVSHDCKERIRHFRPFLIKTPALSPKTMAVSQRHSDATASHKWEVELSLSSNPPRVLRPQVGSERSFLLDDLESFRDRSKTFPRKRLAAPKHHVNTSASRRLQRRMLLAKARGRRREVKHSATLYALRGP